MELDDIGYPAQGFDHYDLSLIIHADEAMFEYMTKKMVTEMWPRGSSKLDKAMIYYAIVEALNGVVHKVNGHTVDRLGWVTEGAIKKGINRLLSKSNLKNPDDPTKSATIRIEQVRSLLTTAIAEGIIERNNAQYILRPDTVTYYRLTAKYFYELIEALNIPKWEVSN